MGLTNKKEEQLRKMPIISTSMTKSKDGKYLVHKTVITHIKPTAYYEAVLAGKHVDEEVPEELVQMA